MYRTKLIKYFKTKKELYFDKFPKSLWLRRHFPVLSMNICRWQIQEKAADTIIITKLKCLLIHELKSDNAFTWNKQVRTWYLKWITWKNEPYTKDGYDHE